MKYCFESQKCLKSKYAFQFYVRPKHSEMSIVVWCYDPLILSLAVDLWTVPRMHTCPHKCITRKTRFALPCYWCESVSHCESICDSQSVNALANLFGNPSVHLVTIDPQWLRTQRIWRKGLGRAKRDCGPCPESISNLYFVPCHFYWQFIKWLYRFEAISVNHKIAFPQFCSNSNPFHHNCVSETMRNENY